VTKRHVTKRHVTKRHGTKRHGSKRHGSKRPSGEMRRGMRSWATSRDQSGESARDGDAGDDSDTTREIVKLLDRAPGGIDARDAWDLQAGGVVTSSQGGLAASGVTGTIRVGAAGSGNEPDSDTDSERRHRD
jgi:hypothetical protein